MFSSNQTFTIEIIIIVIVIIRIKARACTSKGILANYKYTIHNQIKCFYSVYPAVFLKLFTEGESTIDWGNEFQSLITLLLKKFDLESEFTWC